MMGPWTWLVPILALSIITSCSTIDWHENFKQTRNFNIGSSIDNPRVIGSANPKYFLGSRRMGNGNIENEYKRRRTCRIFYEFDPETRIIENWRFEGKTTDCISIP